MSLPMLLAKGTTMLRGKSIYLPVDILPSATKGQESKAPSPGGHSIPILTASPIRAPMPKAAGQVSMTMEVRELLSQAALDSSGQTSGGSTPKRLKPMVLVTPLPPKLEDFPKPVDTSSQVGIPDEGKMDDPTPEEVPATYSPTLKTLGLSSNVPPLHVAHLWEETNKALGDWLAVKFSVDAHHWKLVSKFGMTLHQNKSKTKESIKEAKALCACSIREAETTCAHSIKEAEARCSTAIREAEAWGASQASSIQQSHTKDIQHLEEEAIEEESKGQLNFLSACQAALEASPLKSCSMLLASYQVLLGHTLMSHLFSIPLSTRAHLQSFFPLCPYCIWTFTQAQAMASLTRSNRYLSSQQGHVQSNSRGPPSLKWWEKMPLYKVLTRSHQEAFGQDTHLVRNKGGIIQEPLPKLYQ